MFGTRETSLTAKLAMTLTLVCVLAAIIALGATGALSSAEPNYSATSPTASGSP